MPIELRVKTFRHLESLELMGNQLKEPEVRDLGDGLKELRTSSVSGISRSFFFFAIGKQIFVVHALHKKTQKTPKQDLNLAKQRMNAIKGQLK